MRTKTANCYRDIGEIVLLGDALLRGSSLYENLSAGNEFIFPRCRRSRVFSEGKSEAKNEAQTPRGTLFAFEGKDLQKGALQSSIRLAVIALMRRWREALKSLMRL